MNEEVDEEEQQSQERKEEDEGQGSNDVSAVDAGDDSEDDGDKSAIEDDVSAAKMKITTRGIGLTRDRRHTKAAQDDGG